jgi:hypothetical protein
MLKGSLATAVTVRWVNCYDKRSSNCLKSPDSPKTKALEAYETGQNGLFRCGVPTMSVLETPLSDFSDSFRAKFAEHTF